MMGHDPMVCGLDDDGVPPTCPGCAAEESSLAPGARTLLALLRRGPHTWRQLAAAGLDREDALCAVGDLVEWGKRRVRVGPILLELEIQEADEL